MGFSRQEYWSGLPFPPPGDLPDPGIEPLTPALQVDSLPLSHWGSPNLTNRAAHKMEMDIGFAAKLLLNIQVPMTKSFQHRILVRFHEIFHFSTSVIWFQAHQVDFGWNLIFHVGLPPGKKHSPLHFLVFLAFLPEISLWSDILIVMQFSTERKMSKNVLQLFLITIIGWNYYFTP